MSTKTKSEVNGKSGKEPEISRASWQEICRLETECEEARKTWKSAKANAKELKEQYETKRDSVHQQIQSLMGASMPLFDDGVDEAWRAEPLTSVLKGIPPKKIELLESADLHTLADLTAFQQAKGTSDWKIGGIGPEWREKIENRVVEWLEMWRQDHSAEQVPLEAET